MGGMAGHEALGNAERIWLTPLSRARSVPGASDACGGRRDATCERYDDHAARECADRL
ncbi:hypothetical protein SAMN05216224_1321 [Thioclava dalianensis]|nr:hypothetical protein SAMN05216224_1321 [Thioclava dalianensis]